MKIIGSPNLCWKNNCHRIHRLPQNISVKIFVFCGKKKPLEKRGLKNNIEILRYSFLRKIILCEIIRSKQYSREYNRSNKAVPVKRQSITIGQQQTTKCLRAMQSELRVEPYIKIRQEEKSCWRR